MLSNNRNNNKYQKEEKRILEGYLSELKRVGTSGEGITLNGVAAASGLSYKTVLDHYQDFPELEHNTMETTVSAVRHLVDDVRVSERSGDDFIQELLVMISENPIRFEIEYHRRNILAWEEILSYAQPILTQNWELYGGKIDEYAYHQFCARFIGIMYLWGEDNYSSLDYGKYHTELTSLCKFSVIII